MDFVFCNLKILKFNQFITKHKLNQFNILIHELKYNVS